MYSFYANQSSFFLISISKASKRILLVARKGGASPTELMSGLKLYNKNGLMTKKAKMISEVGILNY